MTLIGIDTGGTFTDFVLYEGGGLRIHKVLSTPEAPEQAIAQGIGEMGLDADGLRVVHGSTVATNAALERKGARTVYIGNRGLGDLLTIGRQARRHLYAFQPRCEPPPVPLDLCLETGGRLAADGSRVEPLSARDLRDLRARLVALAPEAVAINLLFSYLDDGAERAIERMVPRGMFVSRSSEVLPETGEYERGMATWLNAWLGPLVEGYLDRIGQCLPGARVAVMQSSGATISAAQAARQAVRMLLSGPAGGLMGARFVGGFAGRRRLLSFDMGGTSTDVALIDGELHLTSEGRIASYPVAVPMVDMHTIGAGGGSIARLDAGGMLQVGPESAGADPGPACYGRGGRQPTVTDANLLLGRLQARGFLGGRMRLDEAASRAALRPLAQAMGCSVQQAALGVVRVVNEHMTRALRVISVQKGVDPRTFTLTSFGGAGGLHVCALADALDIGRAMVPVHAGVLSALGMLATRPGRQLSRTWIGLLGGMQEEEIQYQLEELAAAGAASLVADGVEQGRIDRLFSLDLRYQGQSYTLNVPWVSIPAAIDSFSGRHQSRYGHRMALPVELVNLRVALSAPAAGFSLSAPSPPRQGPAPATIEGYGIDREVVVLSREALPVGRRVSGPALITETVATTWLAPGWRCEVDAVGNLMLYREQ